MKNLLTYNLKGFLAECHLLLKCLILIYGDNQIIGAPSPQVGDSWIYEKLGDTQANVFYWEVLAIEPTAVKMRYKNNISGDTIGYKSLDFGSVLQANKDTTLAGFHKYTIFDFPLYPGKQYQFHAYWGTGQSHGEDVGQCEAGRIEAISQTPKNYRVIKIKCFGTWRDLKNDTKHPLFKEYWYAPSVRNYVRFTQIIYINDAIISSETYQLKTSNRLK